MRTVFLGSSQFSLRMLRHLLANGIEISAVFTIPKRFTISYSNTEVTNYNYADLRPVAEERGIPYFEVESSAKKLSDYYDTIERTAPDVILVLGWYYMVPKRVRDLARYGAWGIHASLLPEYAGGAPLVWSIIEGKEETGVTLFKLGDGVDDGDIISQARLKIGEHDTIKNVYNKATKASKRLLLKALKNIDKVKFTRQDRKKIRIYPQRSPEDGELDLSLPARELYNFIRAQSDPYPGAFVRTTDGKKLVIEKARIEG